MTTKAHKYRDALDDALDRPIAYNPAFKRITGSTVAGIFLSQTWYWSKRHQDQDGWFYKSQDDWEEETGLTRSEQETARKHCLRVGVLEEKRRGVPATMHYRVIKQKVYELLGVQIAEIPQSENDQTQQSEIAGTQQSSSQPDPEIAGKQQCDIPANFNKESETPSRIPTEREESALDFENMSVVEAQKLWTLRLYREATNFFPAALLWEYVHNTIIQHELTEEKIRVAVVEWLSRGYRRENVKGILEWAVNGIPVNGHRSSNAAPAIDDRAVERTTKELAAKWNITPAPPPSTKPRIGQKATTDLTHEERK